MGKKKKGRAGKYFIMIMLLIAAAFVIKVKFFPKVKLKDKKYVFLYVEHHDLVEDIADKLYEEGAIEEVGAFIWLADKMGLADELHPGKYRITNGMNLRQIINLIRYNREEKIQLFFNEQIHDLDELVNYLAGKLALNAAEIEEFISDERQLNEMFGLNPANAFAMVIPGKLKVSWAITMPQLAQLLKDRYQKVYNEQRVSKARKLGYSIHEVQVLASIVQSESAIRSEQRKIAGVYVNRLKRNMPLQADPTLKYACRNWTLQRVLDKDKEVQSPYNTYKNRGLPPGPICLITTGALDATLNYEKHNYLYFCASPKFNGYSEFSATYEEHKNHAIRYRKALDRRGITR